MMAYLVAKAFNNPGGYYALRVRRGRRLNNFVEELRNEIGENGLRDLKLTIIRKSEAHKEYNPYTFVSDKDEFKRRLKYSFSTHEFYSSFVIKTGKTN